MWLIVVFYLAYLSSLLLLLSSCVIVCVCVSFVVCLCVFRLLYQVTVPGAVLLSQKTWHKTRKLGILLGIGI